MNESILRHLGVALMGHCNIKNLSYPPSMTLVFRKHRDDESLLPHLLQNIKLRDYLLDSELIIPDTSIGCATLVALAIMYGEIPFNSDVRHLFRPVFQDALWNKLKTRLKIRRE